MGGERKQEELEPGSGYFGEHILDALEAANIGTWTIDLTTHCVTASPSLKRLMGMGDNVPPVAPIDQYIEGIHPDDREQVREAAFRALASRTRLDVQFRCVGTDGKERWIMGRGAPVRSAAGTVEQFAGAATDITENKLAAEADAKFRTFFDQGSYFAGVMSLDGTVFEANRVCLDACGFTRDEVIGRKFWDCGWWSPSPDLVEMIRAGVLLAASGQTFRRETPYYVSDGSIRLVDLVISPVCDENGQVIYLAPTGTDITDRKIAEARDRLLVALDDAIRPLTDPQEITLTAATLLGKYLGVDRCAYADIEADEDTMNLAGNYRRTPEVISIVGQMKFADFGAEVLALMRANEPYVVNDVDTHEPPVGDPAAYRATQIQAVICVPLHKKGRFVAAMAVHTVTPRFWRSEEVELVQLVAARCWESIERAKIGRGLRQSQDRLRELNEELERRVEERTSALVAKNAELEGFSYSVSHDMRAPLRAIVGRANMVLEDEGPRLTPQGKLNLERWAKAASQMAQLVDDLLQFARLGTRELSVEEVNLGALVQEITNQVRVDRVECTIELTINCDVIVKCDPRFIGMALHNLIDNACKYRKAGQPAVVEFGCEDLNGERVFHIRDRGIGFDMAYVDKLFVPFERLHREEYAGTGIGLANVRRAIERHGGRIWAEGQVGRGATFYFTLG